MAKTSDFTFIRDYGYPKIDRLVMTYDEHNYEDLYVMLKAAKKFGKRPAILERIHQRYNKLRYLEERKELFKG